MPIWVCLGVEHRLRERQPLPCIISRRIREQCLGGEHGAEAPESLVIVAQRSRPVGVHVIVVRSSLEKERLLGGVDVRCVAGVVPVVDERAPEGAALPPIVVAIWRWAGKNAWDFAGLVAFVENGH